MNQQSQQIEFSYKAWRAGFLRTILIGASVFGLLALYPAILGTNNPIFKGFYIALYTIVVAVTILPISYLLKAGTIVALLFGLGISGLIEAGIRGDARIFMLGAITMGSLLFSWRAGWLLTGLTMATYGISGWLILSGTVSITSTEVTAGNLETWLSGGASVFLISTLVINGIRLTQNEFDNAQKRSQSTLSELLSERSTLEERVNQRTEELDKRSSLLKAVAAVGKSITSFRNLSELLQQTTFLINENFGYYHVGIFLVDERKEYAVLAATNSEGGQRMLERNHRLKVGETGLVGYVTANAKARIALDVGKDAVYFNNPDLPQTRSEIALPLVVGGQTLGALDVQSMEAQAFSDEDSSTLQILAEQLAIAIQNANLFDQTEKALEASRVTYGEISREAWSKILRNQPRIGFIATPPATVQTYSEKMEPNLTKAFESGGLVIGEDKMTISLPIKVRGQSIGAIRLKKNEISEAWTQEETNLAQTLSDQLSGALESARLYRESQQRGARESLVSDISARISAISNTDTIVRETVQELGQAIGNATVTFQLLDKLDGQKQAKGQGKRTDVPEGKRKARE
jgi:GAF domain-containing protein